MSEPTPQTRPEWIWPRADSHVVLSAEGSPDVLKTFVEPGGSFSPGVGSYGISVWVWLDGERRLVCPERLPRPEIRDRLLGGMLPIVRSRWRAGEFEVDLRLAAEGFGGRHEVVNTLAARITNRSDRPSQATVLLVLRSLGPAGGPVRQVAVAPDGRGLLVHGKAAVLGQRGPRAAGCTSPSEQGELSVALQAGEWPDAIAAADAEGYAGGMLAYTVSLDPGGVWEGGWDCPVWPTWTELPAALASRGQFAASDRIEGLADAWRDRLTQVGLDVPDARVAEAFYASLSHLLMAWSDDEARIASVCYPFFWMRDGVYILNALDKAGLSDCVRPCLSRVVDDPWAGGFGPEGDAPGELLWALGEHWLLTRDTAWLQRVYPRVRERCETLLQMRRRLTPLHGPLSRVLPKTRLRADGTLVCEAARHGLIWGRMDWHRPIFWVNAWAFIGLRRAVEMAQALGLSLDAAAWAAECEQISHALATPAAGFGGNERDFVCAIWPTDARHPEDQATRLEFERRWRTVRLDTNLHYHGEPRWRYFEVGEAHNLLRLGHADRALLVLEQFLRTQDAPGLYGWAEGDDTGDPTRDWTQVRGWWPERRAGSPRGSAIVPHGWVAAEMALLIRDLFVWEDDGWVVIGAGMKSEWLSGEALGIREAPTHYGRVTWRLQPRDDAGGWTLRLRCEPSPPPLGFRVRLPLPPHAVVDVDGVVVREEQGDWPVPATSLETLVTISVP